MDMPTFLIRYGFDLAQQDPDIWVANWSKRFPVHWIPMALLEALYQGRYKAASVEQLLLIWVRRGGPRLGFGPEFSYKIWPDQQAQIASLAQNDIPPSPRSHSYTSTSVPISTQNLLHQLQPLSPRLSKLIRPEDSALSSPSQNGSGRESDFESPPVEPPEEKVGERYDEEASP